MVREDLGLKSQGESIGTSNSEVGRHGALMWGDSAGASLTPGWLQGLSITCVPPGKDERLVTVHLHPCPPPDFFRPCRLLPSKSNVRSAWYRGQSPSGDGE